MITQMIRPACLFVSSLLLSAGLFAQAPKVQFPAPSPAASFKQRAGLTDIEVVYSRPGVKDRTIFGGLVPYGQVWRTGANSATKITFSTAVKFGGADIPAGHYELFTIPGKQEWTVIIHKDSSQWGAYKYDQKNDVARVTAKPVTLKKAVETFTIEINDLRDDSATLNFIWDKTHVSVSLQFDVTEKLLPQIKAAMAAPGEKSANLYFQSAGFYYDHDQDLNQALEWVTAATSGPKPLFYMVHLKAKILAKQGNKPAAIAAAKQSSELAAEAKNDDYVRLNKNLIASLK